MSAKKSKGRGGARVGAGRPPKSPEAKQGHGVTINLTESEHTGLLRLIGDEPLASYLRRLVLRHLARQRR